jgi:hypothetical protein
VPLSSARDELVSYRLKFNGGKWFLVDPPVARVGIEGIADQMKSRILRMPPPERQTKALKDLYDWRQNQIGVVEQLRPQDPLIESAH